MTFDITKPDAGELLDRVADVNDTLVLIGGLNAAGIVEDNSERIVRALYDLQLVTQYLQAIGDEDEDEEAQAAE